MRINPATIPELHELHAFLRKQTVGVLFAMTAIMYLGRDGHDDHRYDFLKSYTQISEFCENTDEAPDFLLVKVPLPDYLERGLDVLVAEGLDVDELLGSM